MDIIGAIAEHTVEKNDEQKAIFHEGYTEGLKAGLERGYIRARGELTSKIDPDLGMTPAEFRERAEAAEAEKGRMLMDELRTSLELHGEKGENHRHVINHDHYRVVFNGEVTETVHPSGRLASEELSALLHGRKNTNDVGYVLSSVVVGIMSDDGSATFFSPEEWK